MIFRCKKDGNMKIKTKVTCIRYPGGKSNALKYLDPLFPSEFKTYVEPFFGGGSVGLYLMQKHKDVDYHINDLFYPVYCFWKTMYNNVDGMVDFISKKKAQYIIPNDIVIKGTPSKSAENARELHSLCRKLIEISIQNKQEFETACLWYILNKTSYSGMSMIGSYAPLAFDQNFSDNCIKNLPDTSKLMHSVKSVQITNLDYSELLNYNMADMFLFLDPPYDIKDNLYGNNGDIHRNFNHLKFANDIKSCKNSKWMITYNDNEPIRSWFTEYKCIPWDLQYTMKSAKRAGQDGSTTTGKSGKKGKELLIKNYD